MTLARKCLESALRHLSADDSARNADCDWLRRFDEADFAQFAAEVQEAQVEEIDDLLQRWNATSEAFRDRQARQVLLGPDDEGDSVDVPRPRETGVDDLVVPDDDEADTTEGQHLTPGDRYYFTASTQMINPGRRARLRTTITPLELRTDTGTVIGPAEYEGYYVIRLDEAAIYHEADGGVHDVEMVRIGSDNLEPLDP